jgi:hypothetical protein
MFLKIALISLVSGPIISHASNLQPPVGGKACFAREYTRAHMRANPNQLLSAMAVLIENNRPSSERPGYIGAKVVGQRNGKLYGNQAWCQYKTGGSVSCAIDCDGGSFSLTSNGADVFFSVTKDYYFPLYGQGTTRESQDPRDSVSLRHEDKDNRVFKLFQTAIPDCEAEWEAYNNAQDTGC